MFGNNFNLLINAAYKGGAAFKQAQADVKGLGTGAVEAGKGFRQTMGNIGTALLPVTAALGAIALGAKAAWNTLNEGAALSAAQRRFENLSASINTTAESLLGKMRAATSGMMSDAALMASATDIMSLGLGKTEDQVVRLSTVVGKLGWDMNQVILTMANNSKMRLDALGLSIEDVDQRVAKLRESGMSLDEAFDLAVIEAGEAKIRLVGDAAETTAGKLEQIKTVWQNAVDTFKQNFADSVVGQIDRITDSIQKAGPGIEKGMGQLGTKAGNAFGWALNDLAAAGMVSLNEELMAGLNLSNEEMKQLYATAQQISGVKFALGGEDLLRQQIALNDAIEERYALELQIKNARSEWDDWGAKKQEQEVKALTEYYRSLAIAIEAAYSVDDGLDDLIPKHEQLGISAQALTNRYAAWVAATNERNRAAEESRAAMLAESEDAAALTAATEAAEARVRELAQAFRDAALAASGAFMDAISGLKDADIPDLIDLEGNVNYDMVSQHIMGIAQSSGAAVSQLGELGVALGQFTPEMAEAAAKAVLFQGALKGLTEQWVLGEIDTSTFLSSVEELPGLLAGTLEEIQTQLGNAARGWEPVRVQIEPDWVDGDPTIDPNFSPIRVPVQPTVAQNALIDALDPMDGKAGVNTKIVFEAPDTTLFDDALDELGGNITNLATVITFDEPDTKAVDKAIGGVETAIDTMDSEVVMTANPSAVDNEITRLTGLRPKIYIEIVPVTSGGIPGSSGGGSTGPGKSGRGGDWNVNMNVNFSGPVNDPRRVASSIRNGMEEFYADIRREGVRW